MEWYIPISLLPGIALIILSTSNFIIALNNEIKELKSNYDLYEKIINLKIIQLKRLSIAISGLYISVLLFTLTGLLSWFSALKPVIFSSLIFSMTCMFFSVTFLISFAVRAIKIRHLHLKIH
ncbi:MAG TPA: hypothetical protein DCQ26_08555 [Marinilabiliales bacterium]|nr:MAG: hypothetical protein A2W95_09140 [Bacteroidetes bacterium GWA2_40_14]OFX65613.1 MAG: hypothetical protein A2W84_07895 [Bacteroidetes bacterium GWC2_40_13]OFX75775.1 MAG: hypothetical protein A2W96_09430 [Bacteroidetes bacterium GWD2_40_43]OFX94952.1 MAG: hypothetical protein A2W97_16410 [Bacteroidetes bacterium GWE2_40_63]OFY23464.1 MAG: hypothetical protein A2W88_08225 [Bacteroidetes bacterium GWF2_40_13]OFZ29410.1 MAG: hypothetical protein A2437_09375 [Bacteroidetes bacterium RIFOXYC